MAVDKNIYPVNRVDRNWGIKRVDSNTNYIKVSSNPFKVADAAAHLSAAASTSAAFAGDVRFGSTVCAATDVLVSGRVRSGAAAAGAKLGDMLVSQSVSVNCQTATAATSAINLPLGASIVGMRYQLVENHFGTAAADVNLLVGVSSDDNQLATVAVSGNAPAISYWNAAQWTGVCASLMHSVAAPNNKIFVKTTAVSGAVSAKNLLLTVDYIRRA